MKLACNYYAETEQLWDEQRIDIDYFKYPGLGFQMQLMEDLDAYESFCSRVTQKRPILLHGLYPAPHDLASPTLQNDFDAATVNRLISMTKTPGLSLHPTLSPTPSHIPFRKVLSCIIDNGAFLKNKYKAMAFVSIENGDDRESGDLLKPQTTHTLVTESGMDFLLDISHAFCAARWLGMGFYDYLKLLPLHKTVEIHLNGWISTPNDVMCHTKINEEGYRALEFVLSLCTPQIITIEYGRSNDRVRGGVPILSPSRINQKAKSEIEEQVYSIRELCAKRA